MIAPCAWAEMIHRLRRLGWTGPFYGGKHPYMVSGTRRLTIPNKHATDIPSGTLRNVLRIAGISDDAWNQA